MRMMTLLTLFGLTPGCVDKGDDSGTSSGGGTTGSTTGGSTGGTSGATSGGTTSGGTTTGGTTSASYTLRTETSNFTRNQGGSGTQIVYIDRDAGFETAVDLDLSGAPKDVTWSFDPDPSAVADGGEEATILWLDIGSSVTTGDHTLTVHGDADGDLQSVDVPLRVMSSEDSDIGVDVSPHTATALPGGTADFDVELQWAGGFSDDATLTCQSDEPAITCSFSDNPAAAGTAAVDLTVSLDAGITEGSYPVLIDATAGSQSKATGFLLEITDSGYSLRSEVSNFTINQDQHGSMIVYVDRSGGHADDVTLSNTDAPLGVTLTSEPNPTAVDSAIVGVELSGTAPAGDHTLTIEGTDGSIDDSTTLPLRILPAGTADFSLGLDVLSVEIAAGSSATEDVEVQWDGGFSDAVTLTCGGPSEVSCSFATNPVPASSATSALTLSVDASAASGTYAVQIEGTGGTQSKLAGLHVVVP